MSVHFELPEFNAGITHAECGKRHTGKCRVSPEPTRGGVQNEIASLEREQFRHAGDDEELARINEIRDLAEEQLLDDVYSITGRQRDRVGAHWVKTRDWFDDGQQEFWRERSPEQRALMLGFDPILDRLTPDQRVIVRMRYGTEMTMQEIADQLGIRKQSVEARLVRIHASIMRALVEMFGPPKNEEVST